MKGSEQGNTGRCQPTGCSERLSGTGSGFRWLSGKALGWLLKHPGVTAPIIGATKLSHLTDALGRVIVSGVAAAVAWRQGAPDVIAEDGWVSRGGLLCAGVTLLAS